METPTNNEIIPDVIPVQKWEELILTDEQLSSRGTGISPTKPFQSANFVSGATGWRINTNGDAEFNAGTFRGTFSIGGTVITIDNTQDIQTYLNTINTAGGGTLYLKPGTYTLTASGLTMYSGVALVGTSPTGTIIDFNSTVGEINIAGTFRYNTGTITSITNGVTVVGSGTSWASNVVAYRDYLFINGQWMLIAVVTDDTHITLAEAYDGSTIGAGSAYRISSPIQNITLKGFNVKNSTGSGIDIDDARYLTLDNVYAQDNNIGIEGNYSTEWALNSLVLLSNTSHGISLTNGGRNSWSGVNSVVNGGSGVVLNSVRSMGFSEGTANSNTADGFNITSCTDISLLSFDASSNGGQGIECVSGNTSLTFFDSGIRGNTSDGIKLTATTDNCLILGGSYEGNGGYGINIAASTCDTNIINTPQYAGNSSGTLSDSGTGTVIVADDTAYDATSWNGNLGVATKNAIRDKIETMGSSITYKNGTTTKDAADASATQNIAHGLGVIPKKVKITAFGATANASINWNIATTVYNGTTQSSVSLYGSGNNTAIVTTFTISDAANSSGDTTGVVTFDATNIIITWTKTTAPTGIYTLLWEAET